MDDEQHRGWVPGPRAGLRTAGDGGPGDFGPGDIGPPAVERRPGAAPFLAQARALPVSPAAGFGPSRRPASRSAAGSRSLGRDRHPGPACASDRPFDLRRLAAALGHLRPSHWHPPARRGSGPLRAIRLRLARHRRPAMAGLVLAALWITIRSAVPEAPATVPVLVAARDLPAGHTLGSSDVRPGRWPTGQVASGRIDSAAGRTLASPIRSGELVTDARLVGPGLLAGQTVGTVAVPVRLGDPAASLLLQAGDRVDVLASSASSDPLGSPDSLSSSTSSSSGDTSGAGFGAERVAGSALVLAVPGTGSGVGSSTGSGAGPGFGTGGDWSGAGGLGGLTAGALPGSGAGGGSAAGLLVLAVSPSEARRLTAVQAGGYLGIAVLHR